MKKYPNSERQEHEHEYEKACAKFSNLYSSAEKENPRWDVFIHIEGAKLQLLKLFGVQNLGTIEGFHLRRIVEQLLPIHKELDKLAAEGAIQNAHVFETSTEASVQWLREMYGIHLQNIPTYWFIDDLSTGESFQFEIDEEEVARHKEGELKNYASSREIDPKFKEYISRLRENAHLL